MTRLRLPLTGLVLVAIACREPTSSTHLSAPDLQSALPLGGSLSVVLAACTHHWANPIGGAWGNASRWAPAVVPGPNDVACIDAAGAYTVTIGGSATQNVKELQLGDGSSNVRLTVDSAATLLFDQALYVAVGATLGLQNCVVPFGLSTGDLTIDGTLRVNTSCSAPTVIIVGSIVNNGLMNLHAAASITVSDAEAFRNTGDIIVDAPSTFDVGNLGRVRMESGTVTGSNQLAFTGGLDVADTARFVWSGGTIASQFPIGTSSTLLLRSLNLRLNTSTLSGFVEIEDAIIAGDGVSVTGDIGSSVRVQARVARGGSIEFRTVTGDPVVVDGVLALERGSQLGAAIFTAPFGLINNTVITTDGGPIELHTDSLVNEAIMTVGDTLSIGAAGDLLRNRGVITVTGGRLKLVGTEYIAEGHVTGETFFWNTRMSGTGLVGSAVVLNTSIEPGDGTANRFGFLTFDELFLGPGSTIVAEIGGTSAGTFDEVTLHGSTTLGGTLDLREIAPFTGGLCAQVVPILDFSGSPVVTGQFSSILGTNPGPGRAWRLVATSAAYNVVGYDPGVPLSISTTSLAVSEGGPPATYALCARSAPTALVNLAVTTDQSEVSIIPAGTTFSPFDWELPKTMLVRAIDDAIVEPVEADTVRHTVTSSDPAYDNASVALVGVGVTDNDGNADLALAIMVPPPPLTVSQTFPVTFRNTNVGPTLSTGATFFVPTPTGVRYVSATGAVCTTNTAGLTCQIPGVSSGGFVDFVITAMATAVGTHQITMTLTGEQPDAIVSNNALVKNIVVH